VIPLLGLVTEENTVSSPEPTDRQRRRAHNVAVHALAGRGQSREEIERKLLSRELPEEAVADEIERLEGLGLINDVDLASDLVDRYAQRQGLGRHAVAQKMRERRIAPEVIAHALSAVSDADEQGRLLEVARDRARALRSLAPDVAKRRLAAYLQRRGFRGNDIFSVIDEVLAES
jgi:regulatory protein